MASADVLQRLLDANSNRIANLGTPTTAGDATKTDNSTAPVDPAAAASAGASLLAAPADHVHQGVHSVHANAAANLYGNVRLVDGTGIAVTQSGNDITISAAAGAVNKVSWSEDIQKYSSTNTEDILAEYLVNLDDAGSGAGPNVQARLSGIVKVQGGTGTYKLYVGATAPGSTAGGTVRATISTASTTEVMQTNLGAAFANPGGAVLVQLVGVNSTASQKSYVRGMDYSIG
jgi:hypothetical protein